MAKDKRKPGKPRKNGSGEFLETLTETTGKSLQAVSETLGISENTLRSYANGSRPIPSDFPDNLKKKFHIDLLGMEKIRKALEGKHVALREFAEKMRSEKNTGKRDALMRLLFLYDSIPEKDLSDFADRIGKDYLKSSSPKETKEPPSVHQPLNKDKEEKEVPAPPPPEAVPQQETAPKKGSFYQPDLLEPKVKYGPSSTGDKIGDDAAMIVREIVDNPKAVEAWKTQSGDLVALLLPFVRSCLDDDGILGAAMNDKKKPLYDSLCNKCLELPQAVAEKKELKTVVIGKIGKFLHDDFEKHKQNAVKTLPASAPKQDDAAPGKDEPEATGSDEVNYTTVKADGSGQRSSSEDEGSSIKG